MTSIRNLLALLAVTTAGVLFVGCDQADPDDGAAATGVVVANQGNFSDGNGSVMIIDVDASTVSTVADGLASIVQSVEVRESTFHVVANTGGRIDIHEMATGQRVGQIAGLTSPRYMVTLASGTAYVTNLFGSAAGPGTVSVVDVTLETVVKDIDVGGNPEGIAVVGGLVYVANHAFGAGRTLSVINAATQEVAGTIDVECDGPRHLAVDREADLWVMCTGQTLYDVDFNVIGETPGEIVVLDGATGAVTTRFPLTARIMTAGPGQDAYYSEEEQELYVVLDQDKVMRINTGANAIVDTFGPFAGDPIGAVAYDAAADRLYLGRVPGFASAGSVSVHGRNGGELARYSVGVAPSHIGFIREAP